MLEESVAIVHGLWTEPDGWRFDGAHWQVRDALFRTRPQRNGRRHPPIILGGRGGPRLARLAAHYADEFNLNSASPAKAPEAYARIDAACQAIGRDPVEITRSAMTGVLVADTRGELTDRLRTQLELTGAAARGRRRGWPSGRSAGSWAPWTRRGERLRAFEQAGVQRVMLQDFIPRDLDMIRLMGRLGS